MISLRPITLKAARLFIQRHHRHHRPPQGGLFAVAAADETGGVVAVAIIGRPVARRLADGYTAEVTRLASNGARNACSMLYAAAWRAARALGYRRMVTYTLLEETGTSVRAAGWQLVAKTKGGSWHRPSRGRTDKHSTERKHRWEVAA